MTLHVGEQLETITLAQSPAVTDAGLACLAATPRLRSLTLRQLPGVTGASFPALAAGCAALQTLDMQVGDAVAGCRAACDACVWARGSASARHPCCHQSSRIGCSILQPSRVLRTAHAHAALFTGH